MFDMILYMYILLYTYIISYKYIHSQITIGGFCHDTVDQIDQPSDRIGGCFSAPEISRKKASPTNPPGSI